MMQDCSSQSARSSCEFLDYFTFPNTQFENTAMRNPQPMAAVMNTISISIPEASNLTYRFLVTPHLQ
jgi:hypothetical protein